MQRVSISRTMSVSWDELHRHARTLAQRLHGRGPWNCVVAIARGGLVPAAIVARELDIRMVDTVCVKSYQDQAKNDVARGEIDVLKGVPGDGEGVLIVDDLVDTGDTARAVRAMLPRAHLAVLFAKPAGREVAHTYVVEVPQDTWILFPWDGELQFAQPIAVTQRPPA